MTTSTVVLALAVFGASAVEMVEALTIVTAGRSDARVAIRAQGDPRGHGRACRVGHSRRRPARPAGADQRPASGHRKPPARSRPRLAAQGRAESERPQGPPRRGRDLREDRRRPLGRGLGDNGQFQGRVTHARTSRRHRFHRRLQRGLPRGHGSRAHRDNPRGELRSSRACCGLGRRCRGDRRRRRVFRSRASSRRSRRTR